MQFLQKRVAGAIKASVALLRFFLPINAGSVIIRNSERSILDVFWKKEGNEDGLPNCRRNGE